MITNRVFIVYLREKMVVHDSTVVHGTVALIKDQSAVNKGEQNQSIADCCDSVICWSNLPLAFDSTQRDHNGKYLRVSATTPL
jgi:hypothetical protein